MVPDLETSLVIHQRTSNLDLSLSVDVCAVGATLRHQIESLASLPPRRPPLVPFLVPLSIPRR